METIFGADPDELDRISAQIQGACTQLEADRKYLNGLFHATEWIGPIADAFEISWVQCNSRMAASSAFLNATSDALKRQACEQREASQAGSASGGIAPPQPLNPDEKWSGQPPVGDDPGEYTWEEYGEPDYTLYGSDGTPVITDVDQGGLGDCWVMGPLASEALLDPDSIQDRIVLNPDGTYTVTLYKHTGHLWWADYEEVQVTVDNKFPSAKPGEPLYGDTNNNVIWPMVMEKAIAKHLGGYDDLEGGNPDNTLEVLYGRDYHRIGTDDAGFDKAALQTGAVIATTELDAATLQKHHLANNHVYVVKSVDIENGTMTLYNPWGPADDTTIPIDELDNLFTDAYIPG